MRKNIKPKKIIINAIEEVTFHVHRPNKVILITKTFQARKFRRSLVINNTTLTLEL